MAMRYTKKSQIGKGAFGEVWLVTDPLTGEKLVQKEVLLNGLPPSERTATLNEVSVLKTLRHPGVIEFRDSFISGDKLHIVMEWASGGDLGKQIELKKKRRERFTEQEILRVMRELTDALCYCQHERRLLHRDLKPANVFLGESGDVKLGDFGISRVMQASGQLALTQCGTPLYMAPEMCRGHAYSH